MIPYISLYLYLSFQTIKGRAKISSFSYYFIFILLTIFIGLRYEIGVDWDQYVEIMGRFSPEGDSPFSLTFSYVVKNIEPSYMFFSWIGAQLGNNIHIVNTLSALIFTYGLLSYCNKQEYPWLGLLISYPVLIIVVALGYTRQACAVGIEFFALTALENQKYYKSLLLLLLASSFHISVLSCLFLYVKKPKKGILKLKNIIPLALFVTIGAIVYFLRFGDAIAIYYLNYVVKSTSSVGALYRSIPLFIAALILIIRQNKFKMYFEKTFHIYLKMAYAALFVSISILIFPKISTIFDRFALYLSPLIIYVFSKVIKLKLYKVEKFEYNFVFLLTYFFYTFYWLINAVHSKWFVPYKNILFS